MFTRRDRPSARFRDQVRPPRARPPLRALLLPASLIATSLAAAVVAPAAQAQIGGSSHLWQRWIPTDQFTGGHPPVLDFAGNVFMTPKYRTQVFAFSPDGRRLWTSSYQASPNTGTSQAVTVDPAGSVFLSLLHPTTQRRLVKFDRNGTQLWVRDTNPLVQGTVAQEFSFPAVLRSGADGSLFEAYGVGNRTDLASYDVIVSKYNPGGMVVWSARFDGFPARGRDMLADMTVDDQGNPIIVTYSFVGGTVDSIDVVTRKYDGATGALLWSTEHDARIANDAPEDRLKAAVRADAAGNVYIHAVSRLFGTGDDSVVIKYAAATGQQLWVSRFAGGGVGGSSTEQPAGLAIDTAGGALVTATTDGYGTLEDVVTLRYAPADGTLTWWDRYEPTGNNRDFATGIAVDGRGGVHVGGYGGFLANGTPLSNQRIVSIRYDALTGQNRRVQHSARGANTVITSPDFVVDPDGNAYFYTEGRGTDTFGLYWGLTRFPAARWNAVGAGTEPGGASRLLWRHSDGRASLWRVSPGGAVLDSREYGPYPSWSPTLIAIGPSDGKTRLLWTRDDGLLSLWRLSAAGALEESAEFGTPSGWDCVGLGVGADNKVRLLWKRRADGRARFSRLSVSGTTVEADIQHGPFGLWEPESLVVAADGTARLLWQHEDGRASVWRVSAAGALDGATEYGPYPQWRPVQLATYVSSPATRLLWHRTDGAISLWTLNSEGSALAGSFEYGPYPDWSASFVAGGTSPTILWRGIDGRISHWLLGAPFGNAISNTSEFGPYDLP